MCRGTSHNGGRRCPGESGANAERRRARQRAAYANSKAAAVFVKTPLGGLDDFGAPVSVMDRFVTVPTPPPAPTVPEPSPAPEPVPTPDPVPVPEPEPVPEPAAERDPRDLTDPATYTGTPLSQQRTEIAQRLPHFDAENPTREQVAACITAAREAVARLDHGSALSTDTNGWPTPTRVGLEAEVAVVHAGRALDARAQNLAKPNAKVLTKSTLVGQATADLGAAPTRAEYTAWVDAQIEQHKERMDALRATTHAAGTPIQERRAAAREYNERVDAVRALATERLSIEHGNSPWDNAEATSLADAYRASLSEHRTLGGQDFTRIYEPASVKAATNRARTALKSYPTDWAPTGTLDGRPVVFSTARGRAYAGEGTIIDRRSRAVTQEVFIVATTASKEGAVGPGIADALHEYGHYAQHARPHMGDVEAVFVAQRTTDDETGQRFPLEPISTAAVRDHTLGHTPVTPEGFKQRTRLGQEWSRSDHFAESYTGKEYNEARSYEAFTTGMEALFAGRYGGLVGRGKYDADAEHRAFVLGSLATF